MKKKKGKEGRQMKREEIKRRKLEEKKQERSTGQGREGMGRKQRRKERNLQKQFCSTECHIVVSELDYNEGSSQECSRMATMLQVNCYHVNKTNGCHQSLM